MLMTILQAGPMTTVQDAGRFGYMAYGIGQSGVMDHYAYRQANRLVGNPLGEAVLEMTLLGAEILFDEDALIAYTGADMQARIDDIPIERGRAYRMKKGQLLHFGWAVSGVRGYLAVAGVIDVPVVMQSRSTNLKCALGGFQGRKLQNGDQIPVRTAQYSPRKTEKLLKMQLPQTGVTGPCEVRVLLGPQEQRFDREGIHTFFHSQYTVSAESDRMGIRMAGPKIGDGNTDIISDGIVFGSIQVTSAGLPIVMMADHQTTGGYAKIATVIREDLPKLAQARPGDTVTFRCIAPEELNHLQKKKISRLFRRE